WSMIDIFVVAILVALVQLQNLMAIYPGPAALSFAAVVIFTMLSAMIFDSRLLWQLPQSEVQEPMTNNLTEKAKYE
ncbi:paraquat-inducible protein A, partial [Vibrio parahaemolyticus]